MVHYVCKATEIRRASIEEEDDIVYKMSSNDYSFKINFGSKLSRTLSTDGKRASLLLQPCWIRTNELQASVCHIVRVIVFPSRLVL